MSKLLDLWSDMTGVVIDYALSTPPSDKWLMCYGQALTSGNPATARLRAKLLADGSPYGTDGSGNPLVPDARGRATAGKDDMGGTAANRLTDAGAGINGAQLGAAGGAQVHTLALTETPAHSHAGTTASENATHTHSGTTGSENANHTHNMGTLWDPSSGSAFMSASGTSGYGTKSTGTQSTNHQHSFSTGSQSSNHQHNFSTDAKGGGNAHNNTQPTLVLNKIIRL